MIEGAIYVDGKVVVRYNQPIPKYIKVGTKDYVFDVNYGVSVCFVDESDVQSILDYRGGCCGRRQQVITICSQSAYSHYLDGLGGR